MKKAFYNCDVIAVLQEIVGRHVKHYQSDFEIDKKIFAKAMQSNDPERKYFLWLARSHGTHCLCERDVYVANTYSHNAWLFNYEQTNDPVTAYAVELDKIESGKIYGDLFELDYPKHCESLKRKALPQTKVIIEYQDDRHIDMPYVADWHKRIDEKQVSNIHYTPDDLYAWKFALAGARAERYGVPYASRTLNELKRLYRLAGNGSEM